MPPERDALMRGATGADALAPLEVATSIVFGRHPDAPRLSRGSRLEPLAALEQALLAALRRSPCIVSFSGGRDSSALLAVATRLARQEGLPDPIPGTYRFPSAGDANEDEWQEEVVGRLGCRDWLRLEYTDELDLVGPVAQRVMHLEGVPYPYNLHLLFPLIERAAGGSFVTGMGGDQAFVPAGRPLDVLARRTRPERRDARRIAAAAAPTALRRFALRHRVGMHFPWMTPDGNATLARGWLGEESRLPLRWNERLREMWRSRFMQLSLRRIASLARHADVVAVHPFVDTGFLAALASKAGATGFVDRTAAMEALFADDLPERVVKRGTKASFNQVLWNRHAQHFADTMTPERAARALAALELTDVVDPGAVTSHWQSGDPLANSYLLLQACWLTEQAGGS